MENAKSSPSVARSGRGERDIVLLLEDNETIANLISTVLQSRLGLKVIWSATVEGGRREFAQHQARVGMIVADCRLPDGDGRVVCHEMRTAEADLPVLLTSGRFSFDNYAPLEPGNLVQFLPKPYAPAEIVTRVQSLMAEARRPNPAATGAGFV